jgi:hypothetical protein
MSDDALIAAAEKYVLAYADDERDCIRTDVLNAFYQGAKFQRSVAAPTQGADARPVAIYQQSVDANLGIWKDVTEERCDRLLDEKRRIVYAIRDAAPSDAIKPREVKRDSDFSVTVVFSSCRLASEFQRQMIAASAPMEKT